MIVISEMIESEYFFYLNMITVIPIIFTETTSIRPTPLPRSTSTTDSIISDGISPTITTTATSASETTTSGSTSVPPPSKFWLIQQCCRYKYKLNNCNTFLSNHISQSFYIPFLRRNTRGSYLDQCSME